jgi:hypothetical protein
MRDPEGFRQACQQLLRDHQSRELGDYKVPKGEMPAAIRRLGASYVEVRRFGCVCVGFTPTGLTDFWAYAYMPPGTTPTARMQARRTLFDEIYAARIISE